MGLLAPVIYVVDHDAAFLIALARFLQTAWYQVALRLAKGLLKTHRADEPGYSRIPPDSTALAPEKTAFPQGTQRGHF
jgi:hypothetical protein